DSANKRISVPEAFLAIDAILGIYANIADGLVVYDKVINKHMMDELPFMATENIIMDTVELRGGDRQDLHERIRKYSMEAGAVVKQEGKPNDLLERIAKDPVFGIKLEDTDKFMDPSLYIGRCPEQVDTFLNECVRPLLEKYKDDLNVSAVELKV
ncbi:MAG: adenylosuccinate lyase, partial [Clostridiales bacterium]|nr:adenylosuccinate lyase [Clostridiales bacterium]